MTFRLKVDGTTGKVAVYDYAAGDDAPFNDPTGNIPRVLFHSDLPSVSIIDVRSVSVSLSALDAAFNTGGGNPYSSLQQERTLFAHGRGGIPYVEGRIVSIDGGGVNIPLTGSVPLQQKFAYPRWVHLGADGTNVVLNTFLNAHYLSVYAAMTLGLEIYVTDLLL
jgi:hypothetical protein